MVACFRFQSLREKQNIQSKKQQSTAQLASQTLREGEGLGRHKCTHVTRLPISGGCAVPNRCTSGGHASRLTLAAVTIWLRQLGPLGETAGRYFSLREHKSVVICGCMMSMSDRETPTVLAQPNDERRTNHAPQTKVCPPLNRIKLEKTSPARARRIPPCIDQL